MFKYLSLIIIFIVFMEMVMPVYSQEENPLTQEASAKKEERISLDLKGIDIVELLRILSLKTGFTIVPSKGVAGRVNIFLNNLTFEDVLDIILISQDLASERRGNILYILTSSEYRNIYGKPYTEKRKFKSVKLKFAKPSGVFSAISQLKSDIGKIIVDEATGTIFLMDIPEKLALMEKSINELDRPLEMQIFDLNYAKSSDAKTQLSTVVTPGVGQVVVDERSSKAMISDLSEKMKQIKKVVKALDEESRQVFIEGEIVQITLSDKFQHGIEWEKVFSERTLDGLDFVGKFPVSPALSAYQKITVGTVAGNMYNVVRNFLETYGDNKILSRPRIAAVNNQEAKIMVGAREAYVTQTLSQAQASTVTSESIEFIDVGVKLNVVPTINKEGFVTMKIKPEISSVRETITTSLGSRIPIVETSEAETVVKVKDGTMIMIAGLLGEEKRKDIAGFPVLSKIPIIGTFFGNRTTLAKRTELIIFLTPHIISGEAMFAGTEPEKLIPPDIVPEDIVKDIISKKVGEIKVKTEEESKTEQMPQVREEAKIDIREKIKDIKEY